MNIFLIRHADPDYARDSLTPRGEVEAEKLAAFLADAPVTHVYSSPLGRARRTMEPVLRGRSVEPVLLPWLAELRHDMGLGHAVWNVTAAELAAEPTLAGRIAEFMAPQTAQSVAGFEALLAAHGFVREGTVYRQTAEPPRPELLLLFAHAGLILTLLCGLLELPLAATYAAVDYPPSGLTHLALCGAGDRRYQLKMRCLAARPHLAAAAHLAGRAADE